MEALRAAVKKGYLDMNFLAKFSNGQSLQPVALQYLHHVLCRIDLLEQNQMKMEHLKHSTNPTQVLLILGNAILRLTSSAMNTIVY